MNDNILKQALLERADEMLLNNISIDKDFVYVPTAKYQKKWNNLLKKYDKLSFRLTYTRARRTVCIIVAILILMLSSLSVGAVRETLANFFVKNFSTHATVDYKEDVTQAKVYPTKIEKIYELSTVPIEYNLVDYSAMDNSVTTIYLSNNGQIVLEQFVKSQYVQNIDNQNSEVTTEIIDNREYLISKSKNSNDYTFIWDDGEYVFTLTGDLTKNKILDLCKSLKIKKN